MRTTKVQIKTAEALAAVMAHKANHAKSKQESLNAVISEGLAAQREWVAKAETAIAAIKKRLAKGDPYLSGSPTPWAGAMFPMVYPERRITPNYDAVIAQLESETREEFTITPAEYDCWFLDNWSRG